MIEQLYRLLDNIGYLHPLHPAVTHIPVGLVFGSLLLGLVSLVLRREETANAARYSATIAFIFFFPTVLLGYMDWQRYYAGGWLHPIKIKIFLGIALFLLLCISLIFKRKMGTIPGIAAAVVYGLAFLTTVGL
ncbi:MAG: DUF2231 domain-containing protein, partial [Syntrophorhabdaceae bacterium]